MGVGSVTRIHRYPVKSLAGETLEEVELAARGLPGDRAWAVRDEKRGGIRGAKKIPALMQLAARYSEPPKAEGSSPAEITFPDGTRGMTGDDDIAERISQAIDHPVTLWPLLPKDALDHYRRGAPDHEDLEQEFRAIFGRKADEPLPDIGRFPPELLEFESPPGTYFDAFPLLLMTTTSLETLQRLEPDAVFDARRFRPNLLITPEATNDPFPEQGWIEKRLRIGDAVLEVKMECPRCVMVTHAQHELPKDPRIMRTLVREAGGNLGVYATVAEPGRIAAGDSVEVV